MNLAVPLVVDRPLWLSGPELEIDAFASAAVTVPPHSNESPR